MNAQEVKQRTKKIGLDIIRLVEDLPSTKTADIIGRQLIRCGTSIGANYRAACRAKSSADFIAKMGIVEEEADEALYWMEMLLDTNLILRDDHEKLFDEANQILSIVVASIRTARADKENFSSPVRP